MVFFGKIEALQMSTVSNNNSEGCNKIFVARIVKISTFNTDVRDSYQWALISHTLLQLIITDDIVQGVYNQCGVC